ncbi:helix-turn-helix domain-containing protein [Neptuniibacter sp. CAU 1671]|uniref:winged helix-turn-helix transcriptional regulator n=1 Tax=Neptuniibacter sp. CAU 1671 TaxID=3032593 RepID=UPI0023DA6E4A|nr:helix-turn-helix domain-containing protein [Neptuniibacter sp. CAU 1671]MDF2183096.1 helix-turn-helix domain-containing protein [Neptuniibacter sp. CAU 1671]
MNDWNVYNQNCPTRMVLDRIADKWTVLIIGALSKETRRFGELKREVDGVSQKMLTQTLRALERDGVVHRKIYPTVPPKVEYSLTELGRTLVDLLEGIAHWSESNIESVLQSQQAYDARSMDE